MIDKNHIEFRNVMLNWKPLFQKDNITKKKKKLIYKEDEDYEEPRNPFYQELIENTREYYADRL